MDSMAAKLHDKEVHSCRRRKKRLITIYQPRLLQSILERLSCDCNAAVILPSGTRDNRMLLIWIVDIYVCPSVGISSN